MLDFGFWMMNGGAERRGEAGHRLKKIGEDFFAAAAKNFLNFILAVYPLLSVAD